jgi:glycosyltransferase involved in cell wall biosynthesis
MARDPTDGSERDAPDVSFVIPVFNEPEAIVATLEGLRQHVRTDHEILVVYDFDEDTTVPVVRELQTSMPRVRLHRNDLGRGVLKAMKSGIAEARAAWIIVSMADGSDDPTVIEDMIALARGGADVVAASRYMRGGRQIGGPPLKSAMSRMAGLSLHYLGGVATHDATNNFKLYSRDFLESVTIESVGGFELALELTVKATLAGRPVAEVPSTWRDRAAGQSNFKMRAWLPRYMRWYALLFAGQLRRVSVRSR